MINKKTLIRTIDAYLNHYPVENNTLADLRARIENGDDVCDKENFKGHITCSLALVYPTHKKVLMVYHGVLQRWLLPGGHVEESDRNLASAAVRELVEETHVKMDIEGISAQLIQIDRHSIPSNHSRNHPQHDHWDFRYLTFVGCEFDSVAERTEVHATAWRDLRNIPLELRCRINLSVARGVMRI
ncbi:MAG: NUDIX hydrolase [Pseudonocardiaceae bacterium]